jgi:hypothetical protein
MARVEQPLVTRSWTTEETILPFLQSSYSVIAKQSQTLRDPRGDLWGVDVHCHRRRDAAGGARSWGAASTRCHRGAWRSRATTTSPTRKPSTCWKARAPCASGGRRGGGRALAGDYMALPGGAQRGRTNSSIPRVRCSGTSASPRRWSRY